MRSCRTFYDSPWRRKPFLVEGLVKGTYIGLPCNDRKKSPLSPIPPTGLRLFSRPFRSVVAPCGITPRRLSRAYQTMLTPLLVFFTAFSLCILL